MVQQTFEKSMQKKNITVNQAQQGFSIALEEFKKEQKLIDPWENSLQILFEYALKHNPGLFVSLHHAVDNDNVIIARNYFEKWINRFINERLSTSSNKKLKTYMEEDQALSARIAKVTKASKTDLQKFAFGHAIYMSAENFNGAMLEEYIAYIIEPLGWIWCSGSAFRAIDFCNIDLTNPEKSILLQIKNKYNTENSSSAAIRSGTTIRKWNRLNRPSKSDLSKPIPNWEELQNIITESTFIETEDEKLLLNDSIRKLTETNYLNYIRENSTTELDEL